ncbi:uncharacterized protein LOC133888657 [Phragmites australis]|uniref:uncharacterized protein LOC133888657 n=1 Tax=Phragmites australis TaxID=29695 RepID=UPI002D773129|nr:uncharacterized protein LOC133888657 [Phragmites australis]
MAAGRVTVTAAVAAAAALALLAGGADADCFEYCFKNCVANDKSMADYCNYACDKTCAPDALQRPLATVGGLPIHCQLACVRKSCHRLPTDGEGMLACYSRCYAGCKTKSLPRSLRTGAHLTSERDNPFHKNQDAILPASVPDHPFHKNQDVILPASAPDHPFPKNQDAVLPASVPDHPFHETASEPDHPFHKKQDAVRPASVPDHPFQKKVDAVWSASVPDHPFHKKQDAALQISETDKEKQDSVRPASKPDRDDAVQPASEPDPDKDDAVLP